MSFREHTNKINGQSRTGWEIYKDNFKKYGCTACRCNVENNVKLNAKTNYQILQTLTTEMTDKDIHDLASYDINALNGIGRNVQCMLNVLGANEQKNNRMNWLQKPLLLYPEMLKDSYVKTLLKIQKTAWLKNSGVENLISMALMSLQFPTRSPASNGGLQIWTKRIWTHLDL